MPTEVGPGPSVVPEAAGMLGADHQQGVRVEGKMLAVPQPRHGPAERAGQGAARAARMIGDSVGRPAREQGHHTVFWLESPVDVKGWPGTRFLVLPDAVGVATRMAEGRHRDLARPRPPDIDHEQAERTPDCGVGPPARSEDSEAAVEADAL